MWQDYFMIAGVLLVLYGILRVLCWYDGQFLMSTPREFRHMLKGVPVERRQVGHAVDASPLASRVQQVREENYINTGARPAPFKRELLVESKRQQLAQMAFFQRPVSPEPPADEHQEHLLLLLA